MVIQWFPGHMNKALVTLEAQLQLVDVVIYVLDSRAPLSCINPEFTKRIKNKPIIYVLNKIDLISTEQALKWQNHFKTEDTEVIALNSLSNGSSKTIVKMIENLSMQKIKKFEAKGINITVRAVVIGVPNCGKSTLINNLCGKYKAHTGNKPGVTRGKQWIKVNPHVEVLDMPGTLWPSFENDKVAHNLSYIGSIRDEVLDISNLAYDFITKILPEYKSYLEARYEIVVEENDEVIDIYNKICKRRGFLLKNNEYDYERCATSLIDDFRKGRTGLISLERL